MIKKRLPIHTLDKLKSRGDAAMQEGRGLIAALRLIAIEYRRPVKRAIVLPLARTR